MDILAQTAVKTVSASKYNQAALLMWMHLWGSPLLLARPTAPV